MSRAYVRRAALAVMCLVPAFARAQTTATPVVPGFVSTSGCASSTSSPCFIPTGGAAINNITTSTSTLVKTGAGAFLGLNVNTGQAGDTVAVYDGLDNSGAIIGTYSSAAVGGPTFPAGGIAFSTGLFVVTTGGTPADVTISYR